MPSMGTTELAVHTKMYEIPGTILHYAYGYAPMRKEESSTNTSLLYH